MATFRYVVTVDGASDEHAKTVAGNLLGQTFSGKDMTVGEMDVGVHPDDGDLYRVRGDVTVPNDELVPDVPEELVQDAVARHSASAFDLDDVTQKTSGVQVRCRTDARSLQRVESRAKTCFSTDDVRSCEWVNSDETTATLTVVAPNNTVAGWLHDSDIEAAVNPIGVFDELYLAE